MENLFSSCRLPDGGYYGNIRRRCTLSARHQRNTKLQIDFFLCCPNWSIMRQICLQNTQYISLSAHHSDVLFTVIYWLSHCSPVKREQR